MKVYAPTVLSVFVTDGPPGRMISDSFVGFAMLPPGDTSHTSCGKCSSGREVPLHRVARDQAHGRRRPAVTRCVDVDRLGGRAARRLVQRRELDLDRAGVRLAGARRGRVQRLRGHRSGVIVVRRGDREGHRLGGLHVAGRIRRAVVDGVHARSRERRLVGRVVGLVGELAVGDLRRAEGTERAGGVDLVLELGDARARGLIGRGERQRHRAEGRRGGRLEGRRGRRGRLVDLDGRRLGGLDVVVLVDRAVLDRVRAGRRERDRGGVGGERATVDLVLDAIHAGPVGAVVAREGHVDVGRVPAGRAVRSRRRRRGGRRRSRLVRAHRAVVRGDPEVVHVRDGRDAVGRERTARGPVVLRDQADPRARGVTAGTAGRVQVAERRRGPGTRPSRWSPRTPAPRSGTAPGRCWRRSRACSAS